MWPNPEEYNTNAPGYKFPHIVRESANE